MSEKQKVVDVAVIEAIIRELRKLPDDNETFYQHRRTRLDAADKLAALLQEPSNDH